ncbi:MAG TPA: glycosyltransferase family 4 protein [Gemmatimonadales bacterium]
MAPQLLLSYDFPPMGGGIARWMGELAKRYPPGRLIVSTGQFGGGNLGDQQFVSCIDRLPIRSSRLRSLPGVVRWSHRADALARKHGAEFVWCGNLKPAAYPAKWVKTRVGVPYGVLLHGGDLLTLRHQVNRSYTKNRVACSLLDSAALLVCNSGYTAALCRSILGDLRLTALQDRVYTVPLGADRDVFRPGLDPSEVRRRYGLAGRRWLLSVARLTRHKGIDTGIRVLAQLASEYPDLGYAVVGTGDDLPELESLGRVLGVADRIKFLGQVPEADLPEVYNSAEIYLGLSRIMPERVEGFGISLAEASASGLPVVAGSSGGIPETVEDGVSGRLVSAEQVNDVSVAVRSLLNDRALASRLGAKGRERIERYYNWDRVAAELAQLGHEHGAQAPVPQFV